MKKNNFDKEITWLKRDRPDYYAQGIKRLKTGEPVDYVIGWREFLGCKIDLSAKPLIPREETEFWVGEVLRSWTSMSPKSNFAKPNKAACEVAFSSTKNDFSQPLRVLDLFAGSGCIGLAILKHIPNAHVTFAEKDPKLCEQIKKNLSLFPPTTRKGAQGLSGRARVIQSDIFQAYRSRTSISPKKLGIKYTKNPYLLKLDFVQEKFDVIFANPPYAATSKMKLISPSVLQWEPKKAVLGGVDGLTFIKKFLKQAKDHLNTNGRIYLEFGQGQKTKIEKLIKQFDYAHCRFHRDQFGKWRFVVIE
ncbi:MAG: peptide chain release factor N(5)-glutamine methyltransferase [Candidatus Paceibacterota bacterium]|jgi:release factor glutamine methyltransferase